MLRVLVGTYASVWLLVRIPAHLDHAAPRSSQWDPVGVLAPFDRPLPDLLVVAVALLAPVLGVAFVVGWRHRIVAPAFAVVLLGVTTLDSSWGQVFHTENLLVLHVAVLAIAPSADALRLGRAPAPPSEDGHYGWAPKLMAVVVVLAYVAAGVAKLRVSGAGWLDGDVLRNLVAHDNLRKSLLGDSYSPLGTAAVAHSWLFAPMAVFTLAVELGAPVALLGGRWRNAWVTAALVFHAGVLALMAVVFPYQLLGVAFLCLFPVERVLTRLPDGWPRDRWAGARSPEFGEHAVGVRAKGGSATV
jgi:hypothetical protein